MNHPLSTEGFICSGVADIVEGKVMAFVAVVPMGEGEALFGLGLAEADSPGYRPIPTWWARYDTYEAAAEDADRLNLKHLYLSTKAAARIIVSSMRDGAEADA